MFYPNIYMFIYVISDSGAKYSELAVRQNASILEYCRTSMSALSGCAAGILGLTGFHGFGFYFLTAFILSVRVYKNFAMCIRYCTSSGTH